MNELHLLLPVAAAAVLVLSPRAWARWQLSRAKHPSLAGHGRWASRLARWLPAHRFDEASFYAADGAPPAVQAARRASLARLSETLRERHARSLAATGELKPLLSDLQFTSRYRVPPAFSALVQERLPVASVYARRQGQHLIDLDCQALLDVAGSYGVNLLGQDFYTRAIEEGARRVQALGPVLGVYHPLVLDNARRILALAQMEELSFHMSGTEAVMQAVRLARYHSGRSHIVRFCGAYHGWWDEVTPGPGNPLPAARTYTLRDMHERSLQLLRQRRDIACVLVNPLQALHPNRGAPSDGALLDSSRQAGFDRAAYTRWLQALREVCTERGIALIFDEVFLGFRLAPGGAQEYFGVRADLVTYGKTLGGGLPVGVLCGRAAWMKRFREDRPADICFARGTFNTHPYVMGSMAVFLDELARPEVRAAIAAQDEVHNARRERLNAALAAQGLPLRAANLGSVWTFCFDQPSRYNWLLAYFLREQGVALSWVGSGRMIFALDFSEADFDLLQARILAAAAAMREGQWWWTGAPPNARLRRRALREALLGP
jgi:glutamate-1-semialdehyde 2,1-aminomutase